MKKEKTYKEIFIPIPLFKASILIVVGESKDAVKLVSKFDDCFRSGDYIARCQRVIRESGAMYQIVIHSKSEAMSVISHEAVHAGSMILDSIGAQADHENDEVLAYIVQHICEKAESSFGIYENIQ